MLLTVRGSFTFIPFASVVRQHIDMDLWLVYPPNLTTIVRAISERRIATIISP